MQQSTALDWPDACEMTVKDWQEGKPRRAYEITEEAYYWGLECVPPASMRSTAFLCGEPYTHDNEGKPLFSAAVKTRGKYYAIGLMTVQQLRDFTATELNAAIDA